MSIKKFISLVFIATLYFYFTGCAKQFAAKMPAPLRSPMSVEETIWESNTQQAEELRTRVQTTPSVPERKVLVKLGEDRFMPKFKTTTPVSVNVEGLPLAAFINEVFGNLLGVTFEISNEVQTRTELVTLRVTEPQKPEELYSLAYQVLQNYQIAIELQGDLMRFIPAQAAESPLPAIVAEGLTLPDVPPTHRPIFQFIPLKVVNNSQVQTWLTQIYKGNKLTVFADATRNAIILSGPSNLVAQVAQVVELFDQPLMRGQHGIRIEPVFLPANVLAEKIISVLNMQGYAASQTPQNASIIILPIAETNIILAFATEPSTLVYVQQWAEQLDTLNSLTEKSGLFLYQVKNTAASRLEESINKVLSQMLNTPTIAASNNTQPNQPNVNNIANQQSRLVADDQRNVLLFTGTNEEWARILPILNELDKPAKQVLIEATVAEIVLTDQDALGIEWVINSANLGGLDGKVTSLANATGTSGLVYTLSSAGQVRAVLNAFASNSRAIILSTPRIMVRSGSQATIDVGTEVPILTSQATTDQQQEGNSAILQEVQYRNTGTSLSITPTVYAGRRVDLQITQQVSAAQSNDTSNINSPLIQNRSLTTELSIRDGQSVLLGGLISNNYTEGWSGIPVLSQLPLVGQLFRVDKNTRIRTELVIMIVPYVIDDDNEAQAITETIKQRLELLPELLPAEDKTEGHVEKIEQTTQNNSQTSQ